jgi:hypothetical protein
MEGETTVGRERKGKKEKTTRILDKGIDKARGNARVYCI